MYFNPYAIPVFVSGITLMILAGWTWRFRAVKGATMFVLLALSSSIYALFYAFEISSATLNLIMFWIKLEYIGIVLIPPFLILFALTYTGRGEKVKPIAFAVLFSLSVIIYIYMFTNESHNLFYRGIYLDTSGPFPILAFEQGPWYWVSSAYVTLAVILSNIYFLLMWLHANPAYRKRIAVMVIGSVMPWAGLIIYLIRPFSWNMDITPFFLSLGSVVFFFGLSRYRLFDIIPIARTKLFEELPDGVLVIDCNRRIVDLNLSAQQYLEITSVSLGDQVGDALGHWPELVKLIKPDASRFHLELNRTNSDTLTWFRFDFIPLQEKTREPHGQMVIIRDITELKDAEAKLHILATTDELTGLWNRRCFMETASKELERAKRYGHVFSIIMIDIDHFKEINDTFGHNVGDEALKHLSELLNNRLREVDFVARLGGEEFGIFLPDTNLDSAYILAENLRETVKSTPFWYEGVEISQTISVGVTVCHRNTSSIDELLKVADDALYQAKEYGRNQTIKL